MEGGGQVSVPAAPGQQERAWEREDRGLLFPLQTLAGSWGWLATDQPSLTAPLGSPFQAQSSENLDRASASLETQTHWVDGTGFVFGVLKQGTPSPQFGGALIHSAEAARQGV